MKTQVSMLSVLLMVKNTIQSQRNARLVSTGVFLSKNNQEIFICFSGIRTIQIFNKGFLIKVLKTNSHNSMFKAENEAHSIISVVYKLLDEVVS